MLEPLWWSRLKKWPDFGGFWSFDCRFFEFKKTCGQAKGTPWQHFRALPKLRRRVRLCGRCQVMMTQRSCRSPSPSAERSLWSLSTKPHDKMESDEDEDDSIAGRFLRTFSDDEFISTSGMHKIVFLYLWNKYGPAARADSPIRYPYDNHQNCSTFLFTLSPVVLLYSVGMPPPLARAESHTETTSSRSASIRKFTRWIVQCAYFVRALSICRAMDKTPRR